MRKRDLYLKNWVNSSNETYHLQYKKQQNKDTNMIEKATLSYFVTKILLVPFHQRIYFGPAEYYAIASLSFSNLISVQNHSTNIQQIYLPNLNWRKC